MEIPKQNLNHRTKIKRLVVTFKNGCLSIRNNRNKQIIICAYLFVFILFWLNRGSLYTSDYFPELAYSFSSLVVNLFGTFGIILIICLLGHPFKTHQIQTALLRAGFTNSAGESPILMQLIEEGSIITYVFESCGIPYDIWVTKQLDIENALNIVIASITMGKNQKTIIIKAVDGTYSYPAKIELRTENIPVDEAELALGEYAIGQLVLSLNLYPHILIGGSTGSGKTVLLKSLILQCCYKGHRVLITDFKGGIDYLHHSWHNVTLVMDKHTLLESLEGLIDDLERRKVLLRSTHSANINEYNKKVGKQEQMKRIILVFDEAAEVFDKTGLTKEEKVFVERIENRLSSLARLGRAFGIHLILSTQRPDADVLKGQIKNNLDYRICGRSDNVLSQIILDKTDAADRVPKDKQGMFLNQDDVLFKSYYIGE
ncbi:S-DNA-T family DNA segregation ATPase FtsK/SpoIIIE [Aequitasia blattaphilus]|uniref:FtsK/SpoIIIE domain-containing protein n=1 Tax=Aequitasia blattaphilus TaxID=2949332 RepID=A0ABT1EBQ8_9FIRM|nr:FtsK/SpoIIIE domain-containing protein [Aequitasia blattaphilus]MCP1103248.1 FtsK/SpoIIIE domain-containing protein [Aequitasia blattaphilus]MCR8615888.1 FtsK/SpoIIIE domain-containing protein [Aequitasia blattaphilus]